MKSINSLINKDIEFRFDKLRNNLQIYLTEDGKINHKKNFLSSHIPKEVLDESEVLLDTLINYLIDWASAELEGADIKLQNKFFDADFRSRIKTLVFKPENELKFKAGKIKYSTDPRIIDGLITSGITFIIGSIVTGSVIYLTNKTIYTIVSTVITLLLSALSFKIKYNKSTPKAYNQLREDVDNYIKYSKLQLKEWTGRIVKIFTADFKNFCQENGWTL